MAIIITFFCGKSYREQEGDNILLLGGCCREEKGDGSYCHLLLWLVL
jgi:hypothetical protein